MITAKVQVRFYETDMMGVVHHSNHIRWFEHGRVSYLRAAGVTVQDLMNRGYLFPILSVACQYHHGITYDDIILIETTLESMSRAQMTFTYRLIREKDGCVMATGRTQGTIVDKQTGRITRIAPDLYALLEAHVARDKEREDAGLGVQDTMASDETIERVSAMRTSSLDASLSADTDVCREDFS